MTTTSPAPAVPVSPSDIHRERLTYVREELQRLIRAENRIKDEIAAKVEAAGILSVADIAADMVEELTNSTTKCRFYIRYLAALKTAEDTNVPLSEIFSRLSHESVRTLTQLGRDATQQSTSWQDNAANRAKIAAQSTVAALFLDIAAIK